MREVLAGQAHMAHSHDHTMGSQVQGPLSETLCREGLRSWASYPGGAGEGEAPVRDLQVRVDVADQSAPRPACTGAVL